MLYVCFGSTFWPLNVAQTDALIDAVAGTATEATGIPVRLLLVSPSLGFGANQDALQDSVARGMARLGERAKLLKWTDQWQVLHHPVRSQAGKQTRQSC